MKTTKKLALVAVIAVLGIIGFVGCDGDDTKTFTVSFDTDGGTAVPAQKVSDGKKATTPTAPTKDNNVAGLYAGTPDNYTFNGWYNGAAAWNFDTAVTGNVTLTAKWTAPTATPIDLSGVEGGNILAKTSAYIKNNFTNGDTHTLLLDSDLENAWISCNYPCDLTLIGIGEPRTITCGQIFSIYNNEANITLGKNVTLAESEFAVQIDDGSFTMLDGSKITGCTAGIGAYTNKNASLYPRVFIKGGEITDSGKIGIDLAAQCTLSGNAVIDSMGSGTQADIIVASDWNGGVGTLYLLLRDDWDNQTVIQAESGYTLTTADIAKFNSVCFWDGDNDPIPIGDTHRLELDTANNVIKLVAKEGYVRRVYTITGFAKNVTVKDMRTGTNDQTLEALGIVARLKTGLEAQTDTILRDKIINRNLTIQVEETNVYQRGKALSGNRLGVNFIYISTDDEVLVDRLHSYFEDMEDMEPETE